MERVYYNIPSMASFYSHALGNGAIAVKPKTNRSLLATVLGYNKEDMYVPDSFSKKMNVLGCVDFKENDYFII